MPSLDSQPSPSSKDVQDHLLIIKNLKEEIEERKIEKEKLAMRYDKNMVTLIEEIDDLKMKNRELEKTIKIQEEVADSLRGKLIQAEEKIHKLKRPFVLEENNWQQDDLVTSPEEIKKDCEECKGEKKMDLTDEGDKKQKNGMGLDRKKPYSYEFLYNMLILFAHVVGFLIHCKVAFQ